MGKIAPVSIKYIIHADLKLSGSVEKPDVIGAVFGQTEGLMGPDLELRELQKSGRIGRIDVNMKIIRGKAEGEILLPSSMGKSETALIGAALETIERIGPCDANIKVDRIEDVRVSKRNYILKRAKELLRAFVETLPDAQELAKDVTESVRTQDIISWGIEKLPAGKDVEDAEEIMVVEGRADVVNLLKYGFRNVVGLNGSKAPRSIIKLIEGKEVTVFLDGDRGGDLILKNLQSMADIDFVARAPDGKEVEELTLKEINIALRAKMAPEDYLKNSGSTYRKTSSRSRDDRESRSTRVSSSRSGSRLGKEDKSELKSMADELVGTKGAYLLDSDLEILGKVPVSEITNTLGDVDNVYAVVMDGSADSALIRIAERKKVKHLVAKSVKGRARNVNLIAAKDL